MVNTDLIVAWVAAVALVGMGIGAIAKTLWDSSQHDKQLRAEDHAACPETLQQPGMLEHGDSGSA